MSHDPHPRSPSGPANGSPAAGPPRRRWQFRLSTLLVVFSLVGLAAFFGSGLVRAAQGADPTTWVLFVAASVALPMGLMMALGLARSLQKWLAERRQQR